MMHDDPTLVAALLAAVQEEPVRRFVAGTAADPEANARRFRFLVTAYVAVWTILAAYLFTLSVRLRRLSKQVRRLKERLGGR
jgi:CcmD family protein